jgi:hypothetical protein
MGSSTTSFLLSEHLSVTCKLNDKKISMILITKIPIAHLAV